MNLFDGQGILIAGENDLTFFLKLLYHMRFAKNAYVIKISKTIVIGKKSLQELKQ